MLGEKEEAKLEGEKAALSAVHAARRLQRWEKLLAEISAVLSRRRRKIVYRF